MTREMFIIRSTATTLVNRLLQCCALLCFTSAALLSQSMVGLGDNAHAWKPKDGLYLVLDQSTDIAGLRTAGRDEIVVVNDYKFLEEKGDDPPVFMVLKREPDVPLVLKESPVSGKDDRGKPMLQLTLADEHVETLRLFTEAQLGNTVAILIAGEVVSTHTIKAAITGGNIQITRCDDNACEYLFLELTKNTGKNTR